MCYVQLPVQAGRGESEGGTGIGAYRWDFLSKYWGEQVTFLSKHQANIGAFWANIEQILGHTGQTFWANIKQILGLFEQLSSKYWGHTGETLSKYLPQYVGHLSFLSYMQHKYLLLNIHCLHPKHILINAYRFMLEQNLAKTMLEFQELMTVFQVMRIAITMITNVMAMVTYN